MAVRDRVVRWALGCGAVLAVLSWHVVGPWMSLVLVVLAVGVAAAAYRIEPPQIDVDHPDAWGSGSADEGPPKVDPAERVDQ